MEGLVFDEHIVWTAKGLLALELILYLEWLHMALNYRPAKFPLVIEIACRCSLWFGRYGG